MLDRKAGLKFVGIAVAPLLLFPMATLSAERKIGGETDSRVTDSGQPPLTVEMTSATTSDNGQTLGTITIREMAEGLVLQPALENLDPGLHGFHIHENANCDPTREEDADTASPTLTPAGEAGDHWDPGLKGNHGGPWGQGHLGDLPNLYVNEEGVARHPVYAPRLTLRDIENGSLVIHSDRDNYSDEPDDTGGSGQRIACGVLSP